MKTLRYCHLKGLNSKRFIFPFLLCLLSFPGNVFSEKREESSKSSESELAEVYVMRINLQRELRERLEEVLGRIAQPYDLFGAVHVTLRGEIRQTVKKQKRRGMGLKVGGAELVKLPGLPQMRGALPGSGNAKMSISIPDRSTSQSSSNLVVRLEKIAVRIFIEKGLSPERIERLKEVAIDIAGIDLKRGDSIELIDIDERIEEDSGPPTMVIAKQLVLIICGTLVLGTIIMAMAVGRRHRVKTSTTQVLGQLTGGETNKGETKEIAPGKKVERDADEQAPNTQQKKDQSFAFMHEVAKGDLLEVLSSVSPRTAAAILAQIELKQESVRQLLEHSSTEYKRSLIEHLARVEKIPVIDVENMKAEAKSALEKALSYRQFGHAMLAAEILSKASINDSRILLEHLGNRDPDLADSVREELVLFEDIPGLPVETVRGLIGAIEPTVIAIALQGADDAVRQAIQNPLSKRQRAIIVSELDVIGKKSSNEIEDARLEVEQVMRQLVLKKRGVVSKEAMS